MSEIWFKDPSVLVDKEQLLQFIPDQSMTFTEQMNAIMRFVIYFSILILAIKHDFKVIYFPIFVGFITWIIYTVDSKQEHTKSAILEKLSINQDRFRKKYCTKPTEQNPYMNVLMSEYQEFPTRPEACNVESHKTKRDMKKQFEQHAIRDMDDIFEKKTNDRQFYTVPSTTIPNMQNEFAKWLYGTPATCKEGGGAKCMI